MVADDIMFVNNIPFVVSILRGVNVKIVEYVSWRLKTVLAKYTVNIFHFYKNNGYTIQMFLMDRKFDCIRDSLPDEENINTTAANEHIPEIERKNCMTKQRARALIINFTFKKIPGQIIIGLIQFVGLCLNQDISGNRVLYVYPQRKTIMGRNLAYENHYKFRFGSCVESHDDSKITKDTEDRKVIVILLGNTANFLGRYKLFSLRAVRVVTRKKTYVRYPCQPGSSYALRTFPHTTDGIYPIAMSHC